jgi:hypothetical protein
VLDAMDFPREWFPEGCSGLRGPKEVAALVEEAVLRGPPRELHGDFWGDDKWGGSRSDHERGKRNFVHFARFFRRVVLDSPLALCRFLRTYYISDTLLDAALPLDGARPFPSRAPYELGPDPCGIPGSRRRQDRHDFEWATRFMRNAWVGGLSWVALGSPEWVPPARGEGARPPRGMEALAATTREAVLTYRGDLRRMCRDASSFAAASGGRSVVAQLLREVVGLGISEETGEVLSEEVRRNVLKEEPGTQDERPAMKIREFVAECQALPDLGGGVLVPPWLPRA